MNLDKNNVLKILFIIFVSILFLISLWNLSLIISWVGKVFSVLSPFIIGLCMAFIINIPLRIIENKLFARLNQKGGKTWLKLKRPISLLLSILMLLLLIFLLLLIIIPQFKEAFEDFIIALPGYMDALDARISEIVGNITGDPNKLDISINWETISATIIDFIHSTDTDTIGITVDIISGLFGVVFDAILGFVFSIYILASKETLGRHFRSFLYSIIKKNRADRFLSIMSMSGESFSKFVVGQCTEAVIIGVLCGIGMLIFGMPYVPVISCIIAVTALIPVFGAFIGTAAGAFIILLESPVQALWFIVYIIILQQLETNLIYPRVVGKSVGLPGILVLLSVTIGGGFFGAFGMLVSVPICSVLYTLIQEWVGKRLIARNIDSDRLNRNRSHEEITLDKNSQK